jgi:hypothetical protein
MQPDVMQSDVMQPDVMQPRRMTRSGAAATDDPNPH